jgi:hypothetical protein
MSDKTVGGSIDIADGERNDKTQNTQLSDRKPYSTPRVIEYGSITRLTKGVGNGLINDGNPGTPGRNKSK